MIRTKVRCKCCQLALLADWVGQIMVSDVEKKSSSRIKNKSTWAVLAFEPVALKHFQVLLFISQPFPELLL